MLADSGGNVTITAKASGVSRNEWYRTRAAEPKFRRAWEQAIEHGTAALIDEAIRRSRDGTLRPVFYLGRECGAIREYSDTLLMFLIKQRDPSYREHVKHTGEDGGPIRIFINADDARL